MKKFFLLSVLLIFACSTDSEGNPCIYEPTLTTEAATDITETSATLNGVISIVSENCEVPNNTEQGFVYSTEIQPTLEDIQVNVNGTNITTNIEGLTPNTTYYVRAFLTNTLGDFYGDEVSFSTEEELTGCCDGAPYQSIVYGTQEWTVENACHITYRDGTPIPEITDSDEWENLTTGAWVYYNNDPTRCDYSSRLYNWYAVMGIHDAASLSDPSLRKEFAPEGWHVPSFTEWITLIEYLAANGYNSNGSSTGYEMAQAMASTSGWVREGYPPGSPTFEPSLNNSSGFNALPAGIRYGASAYGGEFSLEGYAAMFWSSNEDTFSRAESCQISHNFSGVTILQEDGTYGFSVRFVKD